MCSDMFGVDVMNAVVARDNNRAATVRKFDSYMLLITPIFPKFGSSMPPNSHTHTTMSLNSRFFTFFSQFIHYSSFAVTQSAWACFKKVLLSQQYYGGLDDFDATNLCLPNGKFDPWSGLGYFKADKTKNIVPVVIEGQQWFSISHFACQFCLLECLYGARQTI